MSPFSKVEMSPRDMGGAFMAEGMLDMSASERERLVLIAQAAGKTVLQQVVAERLRIGLRQVKRLVRA